MKVLKKLWAFISKVWDGLNAKTKTLVPVAIKVVEGIKTAMDGPVDDIILTIVKSAIKGTADDVLIDKIKLTVETWIPKILLELNLVNSIANIEDTNAQLQAILAQLKLSSNETQNIVFHGISSLIIEKLSDGELSWSDAIAISEYYYKNIAKK